MVRRFAALSLFVSFSAINCWAQGLNVPPGVTKDDWEEINFDFNSSIIVDGFPSLLRLAELLQRNTAYKVRVEGHTDVIGSNRANDRLGLARANAVRDFLVKYGAQASQITTASDGKQNPRYPGQRPTYSRTDEARFMNRRVSLTVTDAQGNQVSAGGVGEAIRAVEAPKPAPQPSPDCCNEILKRLDRLDEIAKMLRDLADANADLRKQVAELRGAEDTLRQNQQALQNQVAAAPKPPSTTDIATEVQRTIEANRLPRFQLLGVNVGADDARHTTFTGKGRYFAPFNERFAFEAQAEYLYFKNQREGQFDLGLVDRMGAAQVGLFASFKHVDLQSYQNGGNMGQAALTVDYIFGRGKVGFYGTKGFMDSGVVNTTNAKDPVTGALLNSILLESSLKVVDQAGLSTTVGLMGNTYLEGNAGYLHSVANGNRFGFTSRFIFPLNSKIAFTVEGGLNETLLANGNSGRAVVGLQFGNMLRPKEFKAAKTAVPVDVPRIRYEVVTRRVRVGNTPPVADAGPPQVNVPAGTITLDGSGSYDPDGDPITYQWIQQAGPTVTFSSPTSAKTTFTAVGGAFYVFQLVVRDPFGGQGTARTTVSTAQSEPVQIVFFVANPPSISSGQSSTLSWKVLNADTVNLSGIGPVQATGSTQVAPTVTTTYTLTASNSTGQVSATAVVSVNAQATKLLYCYATPMTIAPGGSATLNWAATNATSVNIQPGVGEVALSGSTTVSPSQTTNYVITATGQGGSSTDTCNVTLTVSSGGTGAPTIVRFSAVPPTINSGQSSTLMWTVQNATTVSISSIGTVNPSGSQSVSPAATTTYTLTATNQSGTATATATVTVTGGSGVTITSFTASPSSSPAPGTKVTLSCVATGATSLTVAGVMFNGTSVTYPVFPTATTTYTCIATNQSGQTDTATVTVPVSTGGGGTTGPGPTVVVAGGLSQTTIYRIITLDASASTSPNLPLTYQWTPASGTPVAISNANTASPTLQLGNQTGQYLVNLTVTDSKGNSTTVTVSIYLLATHVQ
ncbi:MAG: OmpA family protein [Bryobacterales bacterium]|nr:OmpA family protein [Bryobacterales bacterium]MBV9400290.1 OmpA family protein [Bryobacterales bacterium]